MRSTDDQLREIMKRADFIKDKKKSQKIVASYVLSIVACILLVVVTALHLPGLSSLETTQVNGYYGSLLLSTAYMGYVVIGLLAFLLGVCVTLLCLHLRRMRKKECDRS